MGRRQGSGLQSGAGEACRPLTAAALAKLRQDGTRHFGGSGDELTGIDDARVIKALHAAYQWEEHQAKQRRAERHVAAQAVRPAAEVGGAAPKSGLDDRLSAEEWLRRRNSQLRKWAQGLSAPLFGEPA